MVWHSFAAFGDASLKTWISEINDIDRQSPSSRVLSTATPRQVRFGAATAETPVSSNIRFPSTGSLTMFGVAPDEDYRKAAPVSKNTRAKESLASHEPTPLWFGCVKSYDPYVRVICNSDRERKLFFQNGYNRVRYGFRRGGKWTILL